MFWKVKEVNNNCFTCALCGGVDLLRPLLLLSMINESGAGAYRALGLFGSTFQRRMCNSREARRQVIGHNRPR